MSESEQPQDWVQLDAWISAWLDGRLESDESLKLQAQLRESKAARKRFLQFSQLDASVRQLAQVESFLEGEPELVSLPRSRNESSPRWHVGFLAAVAGCGLLAMTLVAWAWTAQADKAIASVTRMSGAFRWTGDAGRVSYDLNVGQELTGGTVDGLSPESWIELQFLDGTSVTVSGNSMLTFADDGQKVLHLKSGRLSADVEKQPVGRPMLVHTRSATLTVMGTSFGVDAELPATSVRVSEGMVRVERTSDGKSVDVPANHRVVAAVDRELRKTAMPMYVNEWVGPVDRRSNAAFGDWRPATETAPATLKAVHFVPEEAPEFTLYMIGMGVESMEQAPVLFSAGTEFELRGQLHFETDLYVGFSVRDEHGEFAGKFLAKCSEFELEGGAFAARARISDFGLDPTLQDYQDKLPTSPEGLLVTAAWCFTVGEKPSGLAVSQFDLVSNFASNAVSVPTVNAGP